LENRDHPIAAFRIEVDRLAKRFYRRTIFKDLSVVLEAPSSIAVTGRNGSGKSTFVKILAGVLGASSGSIHFLFDGVSLPNEQRRNYLGFVSPYLVLYDELSPVENLQTLSKIRSGIEAPMDEVNRVLQHVGLEDRKDDFLRTFSSGMLQRVKYALAILHRPALLILDEPTANLDDRGIAVVRQIVEEQKENGILIIATNDADEANWCEAKIELGQG
jgi:heme exporter protein A